MRMERPKVEGASALAWTDLRFLVYSSKEIEIPG